MIEGMPVYAGIYLLGVLISSISQIILKKSAMKQYDSPLKEYLNPMVASAYAFFFCATLLSVFAYRVIPLSMGPILESAGYVFVTAFGVSIFHEKMNRKKLMGLLLILIGIAAYALL